MIGSISSLTFLSKLFPLGVIGLLVQHLGSHGSDQIFMLLPLPTLHITPSFRTWIPFKMLLHVYEIPKVFLDSYILQFGKYFARKRRHTENLECELISTLANEST
jgi:hypothetical protein